MPSRPRIVSLLFCQYTCPKTSDTRAFFCFPFLSLTLSLPLFLTRRLSRAKRAADTRTSRQTTSRSFLPRAAASAFPASSRRARVARVQLAQHGIAHPKASRSEQNVHHPIGKVFTYTRARVVDNVLYEQRCTSLRTACSAVGLQRRRCASPIGGFVGIANAAYECS